MHFFSKQIIHLTHLRNSLYMTKELAEQLITYTQTNVWQDRTPQLCLSTQNHPFKAHINFTTLWILCMEVYHYSGTVQ